MYLSHTVISKFKRYSNKKCKTCDILQCFEKEEGLVFSLTRWSDGAYHPIESFKLSYKNGKFNFYITSRGGINKCRITDAKNLFCKLQHRVKKQIKVGLAKVQKERITRLIKKFCEKKGLSVKWLSKDPLTLINQLCFPGLYSLGDTINQVEFRYAGRFAKTKEFTKNVLGTNGALTKKLLFEEIKRNPGKYPETIVLLRSIKSLYGLDNLQTFMKECNLTNFNLGIDFRLKDKLRDNTRNLKNFFRLFNFHKVKKLFSVPAHDNSLWRDTIEFVTRPNVIIPEEFDNLCDLHDKVAEQINRKKKAEYLLKKSQPIETPREFQECLNNWNSTEFELVCPKTGMELVEWSEVMKNCVSGYESQIRSGHYYIVGLKKKCQIKYNIGFSIIKNTRGIGLETFSETINETKIEFSQWSGKGNSRIPIEDQQSIIESFRSAKSNNIADLLYKNMTEINSPVF